MSEGGWAQLADELSRWYASGLHCRFWWRDDDLIAIAPELQSLQALAEEFVVDVLVAVIPAQMSATLGRDTAGMHRFVWCQHGYAHQNHAFTGEPNSEFPASRALDAMREELLRGHSALQAQFGHALLPALVPPWNRIDASLIRELPALGFHGLSRYGDRAVSSTPGLVAIDTHVDVVDWSTAPTFHPHREAILLERIVDELRQRRETPAPHDAPFGLLTHHRAMDAQAWQFVRKLLAVTHEVPGVEWVSPRELFVKRI